MGRISKALYALSKKVASGTPTGTSAGDILEHIAENYQGGGGGSDIMTITFTESRTESTYSYTADKTFEALDAHFKGGGVVIGRLVTYVDETKPLALVGYTGSSMGEYEFISAEEFYSGSEESSIGGWYQKCIKYNASAISYVEGYIEF